MGDAEQTLKSLGERVAGLQDEAPEARLDRDRGRARFLAAARAPAPPSRARWIRFAAPLAAALAVVAALVVMRRPHESMRFEVAGGGAGVVGDWIAAPASAELPIRFSDGSVLLLAPGGRARVASIEANGADVALEKGALDLSVVHREGTKWRVRVGPFSINVVGTRFETRWDPIAEELEVSLREGAITVSGPVVGDARKVAAGEKIRVSMARKTLELGTIVTANEAPRAAVVEQPPALSVDALPDVSASAQPPKIEPRASASVAADAPSWRALARDAKYKEALAAAESEGFDAILSSASAADLRALADAARLGGNAARGNEALSALRKRFPGSPEAASAAFLLGRAAQDRQKDYGAALTWLNRYLAEQPNGEFAAEARGRIVEVTDKMGDAEGARRAAERYLASYPNGAHAAYAKGVLARASSPSP